MEYLKRHGLAGIHSRLMRVAGNAKFTKVPDEIVAQMESLEQEVRELIMNTAEIDGNDATLPLTVASTKVKDEITMTFLEWGARPTVELFEELFARSIDESRPILLALLQKTTQEIAEEVFWLTCRRNETHIGSMILSMLACPFENFHEVMVASSELVGIIYQYSPTIRGARNERIAGLLLAALCEHGSAVGALLNPADPTDDEKKQITLVYGTANVLAERFEDARHMWRNVVDIYGVQCCLPAYTTMTEIGMLEGIREFRTCDEIAELDVHDMLLQALMVIERNFGRGLLLLSVLLARPYTEMLCVYSLQLMLQLDKLTLDNLQRLDESLTRLGLYRHAKLSTILDLLHCCLTAIDRISSGSTERVKNQYLHGQRPAPDEFDDQLFMDIARGSLCRMERHRPLMRAVLTEFIAKLLITLEWIRVDLDDAHLGFVLRRIVRACHVMNEGPLLSTRLQCLHNDEPGELNILQLLRYFHAI